METGDEMAMVWMPRDVIAVIIIIGGFILKLKGIDTVVGSMLLAVAAFYFGAEILERRKRENNGR